VTTAKARPIYRLQQGVARSAQAIVAPGRTALRRDLTRRGFIMKYRKPKMTAQKTIDLMRLGSQLVLMHSVRVGLEYFVIPGGKVAPEVAEQIKQHPLVIAGGDGLWRDHSQTWRLG
jgi:hypothetical protein